jgi:hypothetical protein
MLRLFLFTAILLIIASLASADILFGTYTPQVTQAGVPSVFGAMNDWLTETDASSTYRQSIRVVSLGWNPTHLIYDQIVQLSDYWSYDASVIQLNWLPEPYKTWSSPTPNQDIVDGVYDDYIDQFLGNLSQVYTYANGPSSPRLLYLMFAGSPEGNWFPWSPNCASCQYQNINQTLESYVAMYKYVMAKVRHPKYNLTQNVLQNVFGVSTYEPNGPFEKYMPNDGSVQWVGVCGDNWGQSLPGNQWTSPSKLFASTVARIQALNPKLPITLTGIASSSNPNGVGGKEAWITSLFQFIATVPMIKMLTYQNADTNVDLAVFGGSVGYYNWSSSVSSFSYLCYPSFKQGVTQPPFVGPNTSLDTLITQQQFFGQA